jgi:photosystem II stability/assembly factor-like uncharacterized protein
MKRTAARGRWRAIVGSLALAIVVWPSLLQSQWILQRSGTTERLRAVCAVNQRIVWASGNRGTYVVTTDGGEHWRAGIVPGADTLDFRDVYAVNDQAAYLLSIGPGESSRVYKTVDGGKSWRLQFVNRTSKAFFDAFAFWDANHGIAVSDEVDGRLVLIRTNDGGRHWEEIPRKALPTALPGEGAFAASGTPIVTFGKKHVWIGTGAGPLPRVYRSTNGGASWSVADAPVNGRTPTSGIFSVAFRDRLHGIIVAGDYTQINDTAQNVATTTDGGTTWLAVTDLHPAGFRSCVVYVPGTVAATVVAVGPSGSDYSLDGGRTWSRIDTTGFHAVSFAGPVSAGWAVGEGGRIAQFVGPVPDRPRIDRK